MSAEAMVQVLGALMSADNSHRREAEAFFSQQLENNLLTTVSSLLSTLANDSLDINLRNMSGILLRRAVDPSSYGSRLSQEDLDNLRSTLMNTWAAESQPVLLKRLSHIISQSAAGGRWNALIPQLVQHGLSKSGNELIPLLNLVEILADYSPEDIESNVQGLVSLLSATISTPGASNELQISCAKAISACIVTLEEEDARDCFKSAVQPVIDILGGALSRGDEVDATAIMEHLVEVAAQQPIFFKGVMDNIVNSMLTVVSSQCLEFSTRAMALELMVTICETAPALARRCEGLIRGLVPLAMSFMLDLDEEEEEWVQGAYKEEQITDDENSAVGEEAIERVAAGLGGRTVGPHIIALVEQYARNSDFRYRRAAVSALCRLAEGSSKFFHKTYLKTTFDFLASSLRDSSPRVQFQALQAVGQLATLFGDSICQLIDLTLPCVLSILNQGSSERVKGHCLSALINLSNPANSNESANVLQQYLDSLLSSLCTILTSSSLEVQSVCLQLLGCIAQLEGENFVPYYNSFIPGVKEIMRTATAPHLCGLRGKAMECIGLVGEAVGDEVFASDAQEVMEILLTAMGKSDDDTTFDNILPACARISKALGSNFRPYLPLVMPPLLQGAKQEISFSMVDAEEDDNEGDNIYDEEAGTESAVITVGAGVKKRVTLNTHAVQKKNQCGRMMFEFAANLKGNLQEYLLPCVESTLPMVLDKHYSEIRSSASLALVKLFEASLDASKLGYISPQQLQEVLESILGQLLLSVKGEINATCRTCTADALRDVLEACFLSGVEATDGSRSQFQASPSAEWSQTALRHIMSKCEESVMRREEKIRAFQQNEGLEGEDEEAFEEELEEEETLLATLIDAIGYLLKIHGSSFMPLIDEFVAPCMAPYLDRNQPAALRTVAVCMLDDIFEFGGEASDKYVSHCLPIFVSNFSEDHPVLKQASVYGVAQILRFAPQLCIEHLPTVVPALMKLAMTERVTEEEDEEEIGNEGIIENSYFALGILCHTPQLRESSWGGVSISEVAALWLRALPFKADETEAKLASRQLCDAIEMGDALILGSEYENIPELLRVIAEVFQMQQLSDENITMHPETLQRMQSILQQLQNGAVSPELLQSAYARLSPEQQAALQGTA